jgi:hypothetical protein
MTTAFKSTTGLADVLDMQGAKSRGLNLADYIDEFQDVLGDYDSDLAILSVQKTITTTQLLALFTTPISMVAAPATGYAVIPIFAQFFMDYNSTPYDGIAANEDLVLRYTGASGNIVMTVETANFLDQSADITSFGFPPASYVATPAAALMLHMTTDNIATGNSPLYVKLWYKIAPVVLA